jgi:hypothetical protein
MDGLSHMGPRIRMWAHMLEMGQMDLACGKHPGLDSPSLRWVPTIVTKDKGSSKNMTHIGLSFFHLKWVPLD